MSEIEKEILDQTKGVAVEVYKDALSPVVKPIGEILGFLPRSLKLALSGWEKWLINGEESLRLTAEAIKEKVKQIPEDKLVEPEPYIAIPAIQQISYCQNSEELRELYANLLTASMNADKKWQVHPSFVDIVKQLNPDEARIIKSIPNFKNNFMPAIDVTLKDKNASDSGHQIFISNFTTLGMDVIENKENICSYIDNLVRLNILEIPPTYHLTNESLYRPLEESPILEKLIPQAYRLVYNIGYNHKIIAITNYGLLFKQICCQ
jgi:mRNA-degrading endonuclease RelE of RelBE toxin-antitoxin system